MKDVIGLLVWEYTEGYLICNEAERDFMQATKKWQANSISELKKEVRVVHWYYLRYVIKWVL